MKTLLIIDGQGGKMGRQIAEALLAQLPDAELICVGTNAMATATMMKSGVKKAATGENAAVVCARKADLIIGSVGIVIADSMLGEITPAMALAIAQSPAQKILIPMSRCGHFIAGTSDLSLAELVQDAVRHALLLAQSES